MKRSFKGLAAVAVTALATAGLAVLAPAAQAATGSLSLSPTSGNLVSTPNFVAPACSNSNPYVTAWISGGPSNWAAESYVWKNIAPRSQGDGVSSNLIGFAGDNTLTWQTGDYDLEYICTDANSTAIFDTFTGKIHIQLAGSTAQSTDTYSLVVAPGTPSSLTPVTANPATGIDASTSVQLSTTVKAAGLAGGVTAGGTVQFKANGTAIGAPVTVSNQTNAAAGVVATQTVTFGTAGAKAVTAAFTPTDPSVVAASDTTANPLNLSVSGVSVNTSLALSASATSITTLDNVVLTATATAVGGAVPAGTVTFTNGGATIGTATLNAAGVATLAVSGATLGVGGPYTLGASLAGGAGFNNSTAGPVQVSVTAPSTLFQPAPSPQTIQTNVVAGTITVSGGVTAASGNVTLGFPGINDGGVQKYALQLNPGNTVLTNAGAAITDGHNSLYRLVVTDSRAGNTGYRVTGVVASNFTSGANTIDSATLGWSPKVSAVCTGTQIPSAPTFGAGTGAAGTGYESAVTAAGTDCSQVAATPGATVAPGVTGTTDGLKTARTLYSTTAGASTGTVSVSADLLLNAPTTTKAGYYKTDLTLTALSN